MVNIKTLRNKVGVTQVEMAEHFKVSQTAIVKWESPRYYPPTRRLPEIAKYLHCSIEDLFDEEVMNVCQN